MEDNKEGKKKKKNKQSSKIEEFAFSPELGMGYCIFATGKGKITAVSLSDHIIFHHCRDLPDNCDHIQIFQRMIAEEGNEPPKVENIISSNPWNAAMATVAKLLKKEVLVDPDPFLVMRAYNSMPDPALCETFMKSLIRHQKSFFTTFFDVLAIISMPIPRNWRKTGEGEERLFESHLRLLTEEIRESRWLQDITQSSQKFFCDCMANGWEKLVLPFNTTIKSSFKDIWKKNPGDVAEFAFRWKGIRWWVKTGRINLPKTLLDLTDEIPSPKSENERKKINLFMDILEGKPQDERMIRRAIRKCKNEYIRRYIEKLSGKPIKTIMGRIPFDDLFIHLMELNGERPVHDFPIRRYHENVYLPKNLLDSNPTLKFIIKRIKTKEFLTYDEIKTHLKFFKWLAGEPMKSNWMNRPKRRKKKAIHLSGGEIIQVDVGSNAEWGDQFVLEFRGRQLLLDPRFGEKMGIEPFDYVLCNIQPHWKLEIEGVIELDVLRRLISHGRKVWSSVLPWHLVNQDKMPTLDEINAAIRVARRLKFVKGSELLTRVLEQMVAKGHWWFEKSKFTTLLHEVRKTKETSRNVQHELAERFLLFIPETVQKGLVTAYGNQQALLDAIVNACQRYDELEQIIHTLLKKT